jgi:signal transduction histidine kinase
MAVIGQLAAGVAHELNNPIGIIRGYLKTMSPDEDPETLREELQIVDEEAAQCQRIAEDLLSYARASELSLESVDLPSFFEETVRRFSESSSGIGSDIRVDAEAGQIQADRARLRQVLLNLLLNATQASPEGESVILRGQRVEGGYEFAVFDRGPGVGEADRARIFEPFFSKRRGGSGLGLSVCHGIVEAHRGRIWVEARSAEPSESGAVFRVELPLFQEAGGVEP